MAGKKMSSSHLGLSYLYYQHEEYAQGENLNFSESEAVRSELNGALVFRPYLTYLKYFGLYFEDPEPKAWTFWKIFSAFHVAIYVCFFIFNVTTSVLYVDRAGEFEKSAMFIIQSLWMAQNVFVSYNCFRISFGAKLQKGFLNEWGKIFSTKAAHVEIVKYAKKSQRNVMIMAGTIQVVNSFIFLGVNFECLPGADVLFPARRHLPPTVSFYMQRVSGVLNVMGASPWDIGKCLFIVICTNLNKLYEVYNRELHRFVLQPNFDSSQIEILRQLHNRITNLVETFEKHFSFFLFASFLTNLGLIVANTNGMLSPKTPDFETVLGIAWVTSDLSILSSMMLVGANTNRLAHACLPDLRRCRTRSLPPKHSLQLSLFINKISQTTIGVSGLGFFLLSNNFLANFLSAYVSYYFLLVQMKPNKNLHDTNITCPS